MRRRQFLSTLTAAGLRAAVGPALPKEDTMSDTTIPRRPYGKSGRELSVVGRERR